MQSASEASPSATGRKATGEHSSKPTTPTTPTTPTEQSTSRATTIEQITAQGTTVAQSSGPALDVDEAVEHPDYDSSDLDSAYNSSLGTGNTASLASSIYNYRYENGRRYHAYREGVYVLPNDESEQERLDLHHHIYRLHLGGNLYTAPLTNPSRILDLGTGTGVWAIEMADEFPDATVQGVDLSPIQPGWVPPNCKFHVDDFDGEWTYAPHEAFDYIHGRSLGGTSADWPKLYRQIYNNLKPGGWVEMQEFDAWIFSDDDSMAHAKWVTEWCEGVDEASERIGRKIDIAKYHRQRMIDAGFVDVSEKVSRSPIGPWAKDERLKELGRWERAQILMSVEAHTPALWTRVLGYTHDQTQVFMENTKAEFLNRKLHLIVSYRFTIGRRPE